MMLTVNMECPASNLTDKQLTLLVVDANQGFRIGKPVVTMEKMKLYLQELGNRIPDHPLLDIAKTEYPCPVEAHIKLTRQEFIDNYSPITSKGKIINWAGKLALKFVPEHNRWYSADDDYVGENVYRRDTDANACKIIVFENPPLLPIKTIHVLESQITTRE